MHPALPFTIAALLFGIGVYGVLVRRNAVLLLMAVELMLNAVNLIFISADAAIRTAVPRAGQSFALFVIVLAAAEIGVGLALILQLYRMRRTVGVEDLPLSDVAPPDGDAADAPGRAGADRTEVVAHAGGAAGGRTDGDAGADGDGGAGGDGDAGAGGAGVAR